jgi:hypothetical protein
LSGTGVDGAGGKALPVNVGLIVDAVPCRTFDCQGCRGSLGSEDGLVDNSEGVIEIAGEFVGRQESTAVGELVREASGLEGGKEEGAVVAVVDLRNPDRAACIEAVEVLM